jgi:hypothetical protein
MPGTPIKPQPPAGGCEKLRRPGPHPQARLRLELLEVHPTAPPPAITHTSPWPSGNRRRPAKPHTPVRSRAGSPPLQPKEAAVFTLGMRVLIDGAQAGWITGIAELARQGQGVWVDVQGRLRLFVGGDLYRLEPVVAGSTR